MVLRCQERQPLLPTELAAVHGLEEQVALIAKGLGETTPDLLAAQNKACRIIHVYKTSSPALQILRINTFGVRFLVYFVYKLAMGFWVEWIAPVGIECISKETTSRR